MDRFRSMETFVRVARSGSFTVAANQLNLSRALVSRHVGSLEQRLGVRLLNRTTRSLHLTDEGRSYLAFCERLFRDIEGQERAILQVPADPAGTLRIAAPKSFGALHLSDAVIAFAKLYPRLHVQLVLENVSFKISDFGKRGFDLMLQFTPVRHASLIERPVTPMDWVVCAAPSLLAREGRLTSPADLATRPCLLHETALPNDRQWPFDGPRGPILARVNGVFTANSALALRKAALAGLGIALLPRYVVHEDLSAGHLVQVLPRYKVASRPLVAAFPKAPEVPHKVQLFVDFLTHWITTREPDLIAPRLPSSLRSL